MTTLKELHSDHIFARALDDIQRYNRHAMGRMVFAFFFAGLVSFLSVFSAGCTDDEMPVDETPTCPELGCENAFCTADGACTCVVDGEPMSCVFEEESDGE